MPPVDNLTPGLPSRRHATRAEGATLLGMLLVIGSLFLAWERQKAAQMVPLPGALYTDLSGMPKEVVVTGFQTAAHWPLTLGAILCGAALLWSPDEKTRLPLAFLQGVCGLLCFVIALRAFAQGGFAPLPGVIVALIGGGLLAFGAIDRFTASVGNSG